MILNSKCFSERPFSKDEGLFIRITSRRDISLLNIFEILFIIKSDDQKNKIPLSPALLDEDENSCDVNIDDTLLDSNSNYAFSFDLPSWFDD